MPVEVLSSNRFVFEYGGTVYPVLSFSGIEVKGKTAGHALPVASGQNAQMTRQTISSGYYDNSNFTIEAVVQDSNKQLYDLWEKGLPATYKGGGKWSECFTQGKITILDSDAKEAVSYDLKDCQIVSYAVSEFSVESAEFLKETYEFNCQMVKRTK